MPPAASASSAERVDRAEGDVNRTAQRNDWQREHIGDATRALLESDAAHFLHQALSTPCLNALRAASGCCIEDVEGRRYLDFHGNNVHQLGHGHPRVIAAVKRALDTLPFSPRRYTNQHAVELAARLAELAPEPLGKVLLAPGGAEAMGIALQLARVATGRFKTVSMWNAFHGASLDTIGIGGEAMFRRGIGPLLPGAEHVPPCDPGGCRFACAGSCNATCASFVDDVLAREGDVGAVIVETVRCTDVQVPPPRYYQLLREACDRHGALLILDEIPIALGRTGRMFAFEHYDVVPDIVVLGKGLGGGVWPLAAVIARRDLDVAGDRALGHYTHEKSPVGCAAALATLDCLQHDGLLERAQAIGRRMRQHLDAVRGELPWVREVRSIGALLGVELCAPDGTPAPEQAESVMYRCLSGGLSFKVGQGNVLNLSPPLVIDDAELDRALDVLVAALRELPPP
ncbi:5-aminovalerate aminotransferase DavT [mine drainage metagenome]|uniref:5-aminovalerate aminotransferase DavT n=1 Tax=mine drainage metagenome TaxID=410659 RepID=A0A1J5R043_9ZZZZ